MKKVLAVLVSALLMMTMVGNVMAYDGGIHIDFEEESCQQILESVEIWCFEKQISLDGEKAIELLECVKKDRENIPEDEIRASGWGFEVRVNYVDSLEADCISGCLHSYFIDPQHTNTINWVKENGYWEDIAVKTNAPIYIIEAPTFLPYMDFWDKAINLDMNKYEVVKVIEGEDVQTLCEYAYNTLYDENVRYDCKYLAYQQTESGEYRYITTFTAAQLAEVIK